MKLIFCLLFVFSPMIPVLAAEPVGNATKEHSVGIVAHRGYWNCDAGGRARNSFAALKAACDAGFWGTEFDVCMTADGELLVFHDESVRGKRIDHTTYAELADYRL